jgi:hypothetical protein
MSASFLEQHRLSVQVQKPALRAVHAAGDLPGPDPERTSYGSFGSFSDPDGNAWIVQDVTTRRALPTAAALAG